MGALRRALAAFGGAVALTALAIGAAYPGAWTQEQGSGDAILSGAFTTSDYAFAPDGRVGGTAITDARPETWFEKLRRLLGL